GSCSGARWISFCMASPTRRTSREPSLIPSSRSCTEAWAAPRSRRCWAGRQLRFRQQPDAQAVELHMVVQHVTIQESPMRKELWCIALGLAVFASGCAQTAPAGLSDADRTAIKHAQDEWVRLTNAKDWPGAAKAYWTN